MSLDLINGIFELGGFFAMLLSIRRVLHDRAVAGVSWAHILFFALWGAWNVFYYPSLGQWLSFAAGLLLCLANLTYAGLLFYFSRKRQ